MTTADTIVACATPPGRGGVAVVRISGVHAQEIALSILRRSPNTPLKPRYAYFSQMYNTHQCIDEGVVIAFPGPHSFTGEDVVELQGHGGPYIIEQLIERCCQLGARRANPGEFSLRAFLNDKIDLAQAEAIADLIDAQSVEAAQSAMASLQGRFSMRVDEVSLTLLNLRVYVEAAMDFPDEEIDFLADTTLRNKIDQFLAELNQLLIDSSQGVTLREGLSVALLGAPNAGKSSLLNLLSGDDTAIVTDIAGTTRDLLKCDLTIAGYPLQIVDTAGLRDTENPVEQEGIRRAQKAAGQAEHIFFLLDATELRPRMRIVSDLLRQLELPPAKVTMIVNKIDLLTVEERALLKVNQGDNQYLLCATSGDGFEGLERRVEAIAGGKAHESPFSARQRHIQSLQMAHDLCCKGYEQLCQSGSGELFAEDLKLAHQSLGEITGKVSSDDLLGHIFSSFCIGK